MYPILERLKKEDQITRYCLIGTGIVCGLEIYIDENYFLCITAGTAITSDGTYVEVPTTKVFKYYRSYDSGEDYLLFEYDTWMLVEEDQFQAGDDTLKPQNSQQKQTPFLGDKIIVLYLEKKKEIIVQKENGNSKEEKEKSLFPEYILRYLLIKQSDLLHLLELKKIATNLLWERLEDDQDVIYSDELVEEQPNLSDLNRAVNPALRLQEIPLLRFGFGVGNPYVCPPKGEDISAFPKIQSLDDIYNGNEDSNGANDGKSGYVQAIDEAVARLVAEMGKLDLFLSVLGNLKNWNLQEILDILKDKWEAYKTMNEVKDKAVHKKEYVQYFYGWIRDLVQGYNELRKELIELVGVCFPDTNKHPRHLLLGMPLKGNIVNTPQPFRHVFQQPPIYNGNADRMQMVKQYFWRLLMMIKGFYLPDYIPQSYYKRCNIGMEDGEIDLYFDFIKITPSRFFDKPLGVQSIPFYYPVYDHRFSVHQFWNYSRTKTGTIDHLLSYHASEDEHTYTEIPQVVHPLHYDLNDFDFYRIEGHIGHPANQNYDINLEGEDTPITIFGGVIGYLKYLIQKYNLDFEIHAETLSAASYLTEFGVDNYVDDSKVVNYNFWSSVKHFLGMEHLGGVRKGGTFVLLFEDLSAGKNQDPIVVADFSLPYKISSYTPSPLSLKNQNIINDIQPLLDKISGRLVALEGNGTAVTSGNPEGQLIESIRKDLSNLDSSYQILKSDFEEINKKIKTFEDQTKTDEGAKDMVARLENLSKEVGKINTDIDAFQIKVNNMGNDFTSLSKRIKSLEDSATVIKPKESPSLLDKIGPPLEGELPVRDIKGIGNAMAKKLNEIGIETVNQLARLEDSDLDLLEELMETNVSKRARNQEWIRKAREMVNG